MCPTSKLEGRVGCRQRCKEEEWPVDRVCREPENARTGRHQGTDDFQTARLPDCQTAEGDIVPCVPTLFVSSSAKMQKV